MWSFGAFVTLVSRFQKRTGCWTRVIYQGVKFRCRKEWWQGPNARGSSTDRIAPGVQVATKRKHRLEEGMYLMNKRVSSQMLKLYDIIISYWELVCVCDDQAFKWPYLLTLFFHATVSLVQILYLCLWLCVLTFISTACPAVLDSRKLLFSSDPLNYNWHYYDLRWPTSYWTSWIPSNMPMWSIRMMYPPCYSYLSYNGTPISLSSSHLRCQYTTV